MTQPANNQQGPQGPQGQDDLTISVIVTIKREDIFSLLVSALEGGSNYWVDIPLFGYKANQPTEWVFVSDPDYVQRTGKHFLAEIPLNPGGEVFLVDKERDDDGVMTLNWEAIKKGFAIMAEKYPQHMADFLNGNADAITGDVFLQCCLLGEITYS